MNTTHDSYTSISSGNVNIEHPTMSNWTVSLTTHGGNIGAARLQRMLENSHLSFRAPDLEGEVLHIEPVPSRLHGSMDQICRFTFLSSGEMKHVDLKANDLARMTFRQVRPISVPNVHSHVFKGFPLPVKYRRGGNLTLEYVDANDVQFVPLIDRREDGPNPVIFRVEGEWVAHGWRYCIDPELLDEAIRVKVTSYANAFSSHRNKFQQGETIRHVHEGWYAAVVGVAFANRDPFAPDLHIVRGPNMRPEPAFSIEFEKV